MFGRKKRIIAKLKQENFELALTYKKAARRYATLDDRNWELACSVRILQRENERLRRENALLRAEPNKPTAKPRYHAIEKARQAGGAVGTSGTSGTSGKMNENRVMTRNEVLALPKGAMVYGEERRENGVVPSMIYKSETDGIMRGEVRGFYNLSEKDWDIFNGKVDVRFWLLPQPPTPKELAANPWPVLNGITTID